MWTWVNRDTTPHPKNYQSVECVRSSILRPYERAEARACWIDACDNLWLMGGYTNTSSAFCLNDLVYYDIKNDIWVWVDNDTFARDTSIYGIKGVPAAANTPAVRSGAVPFTDKKGHLWFFGGIDNFSSVWGMDGDMWMYTIDTTCSKCSKSLPDEFDNIATDPSIKVFPNPNYGEFTVESGSEIVEIKMLSMLGEQVFSQEVSGKNARLHLGCYTPGLYILYAIFRDGSGQKLMLTLL